MDNTETVYVEKKVVCKKCGHLHDFNIRTNLSISNFTFNATCVGCGARIALDLDTLFKGGKAPEQIGTIPDPYSVDVDASASKSSSGTVAIDLDAVEGVDDGTSSSSSSGSSNDNSTFDSSEPMPDVSSFFDEVENL